MLPGNVRGTHLDPENSAMHCDCPKSPLQLQEELASLEQRKATAVLPHRHMSWMQVTACEINHRKRHSHSIHSSHTVRSFKGRFEPITDRWETP